MNALKVASRASASPLTTAHRPLDLNKLAGLSAASLLPALFWVGVTAGAANVFGYEITPAALTTLGAAISMFLLSVCAPIMLRR